MQSAPISAGNPESSRRVVIIHGYTGSPDEFRDFAAELAKRLDAHVTAPLLPGHGTHESDLYGLTFDDLYEAVRAHVREAARSGRELVLIGHSFGGYLSLLAAREFVPKALVLTVIPYHLRFPLSLPGMASVMRLKLAWDKKLTDQELEDRKGAFFYPRMPGEGLALVLEGKRRVEKILSHIRAPILTVHGHHDALALPDSGEKLIRKSGKHPKSKSVILPNKSHGIFYGAGREDVQKIILQFLETALAHGA